MKNLGKKGLFRGIWESVLYTVIAVLSLTFIYGLFQLVLNVI